MAGLGVVVIFDFFSVDRRALCGARDRVTGCAYFLVSGGRLDEEKKSK